MCCQKVLCASAATACCPTASANNCCPWRAHCSPNRDANRCLSRRCPIALRGTAPAAERPCASSSASPLQNSTSQPSIPHEHRRQHAPTACSLHVSAAVCASRSEQLHGYAQSHPEVATCKSGRPQLNVVHRQRRKTRSTESLTGSPDPIQYP